MEEGLGGKLWLWLAGVLIGGAVVMFVILMLISHALYTCGFVGAMVVLGLLCGIYAWVFDRRDKRRLDWESDHPEPHEGQVQSDHMERF